MVKSLVFFFVLISFFCRNGTAYLILVRIGLQYIKGWLGAILLKMTQLSCIAIAWQYFFAAWFKWIYPQEPTTRIHKIFVLFIEFHVVSKFPRNKDGQKLRERTNRHFISFLIKATGRKFCRNNYIYQTCSKTSLLLSFTNRFHFAIHLFSNDHRCSYHI